MFNFTIQDFLGSVFACVLFPFVMVIPGYVIGWTLNLFDFKSRRCLIRYLIGIVVSNACIPILTFLIVRFLPYYFVLLTLLVFAGAFFIIEFFPFIRKGTVELLDRLKQLSIYERMGLSLGGLWIIFSLGLLLDLQIGHSLYFPTVSYDYTSRIAIINAISRTGIPPINPGYFPGHPQQLAFLYFYWYIPESIIDQLGGNFINSRQAMIAGVIWTGLCLMAVVALYIRLRNKFPGNPWRTPLIGVQLLLVSGVDFIPVVIMAPAAREIIGQMMINGQIESWNMPIVSWLNAVTWVPNHIAAVIQCITAILAIVSVYEGTNRKHICAGILASAAFASALGTSVWVTLVFAVFWIIWSLFLAWPKKSRSLFWLMGFSSFFGAALSIPFILGLINSGSTSAGNFPVAFYIRPFILSALLVPEKFQPISNLITLPLNYFMELGFFFILGIYWLRHKKVYIFQKSLFVTAEIILLATITILLSFTYSTIIETNILGIRPWLLGQFVLLIWATDVIQSLLENYRPTLSSVFNILNGQGRIGRTAQVLLVIGLMTTGLEAFSTRMWPILVDWNVAGFPNDLSPDRNLGSRTYDARLAYQFVNQLPATTVAQNNPDVVLDRPSGLYGTIQFAISDRTAYGVPPDEYKDKKNGISEIFNKDDTWLTIDGTCKTYFINTLVVNDLDPLWKLLPDLEKVRNPLYQNNHYSVLHCGT